MPRFDAAAGILDADGNTSLVVERYPEGEEAGTMRPGDFVVTHGHSVVSRAIRFGQRLRCPKEFAAWNHAALVVSEDGEIAEALSEGVERHHISRYEREDYYLARISASDEDRRQMMAFAESVLAFRGGRQGMAYAWLVIASIALNLLTGSRLVFGRSGTTICSGFVAEAMTRAGYIFRKPASHVMPAELAMFCDARWSEGARETVVG